MALNVKERNFLFREHYSRQGYTIAWTNQSPARNPQKPIEVGVHMSIGIRPSEIFLPWLLAGIVNIQSVIRMCSMLVYMHRFTGEELYHHRSATRAVPMSILFVEKNTKKKKKKKKKKEKKKRRSVVLSRKEGEKRRARRGGGGQTPWEGYDKNDYYVWLTFFYYLISICIII